MKRKYNLLDGQEIRLTVLCANGWSGGARIVRVESQVASVVCATAIDAGAALRLDAGDALLLGECSHCEPDGTGFKVEIALQQVIPSVSDLSRLVSAICGAKPRRGVERHEGSTVARATS